MKGYRGLAGFIRALDKEGELLTINQFADPVLEMTEFADRIVKSNGKALLFTNTGTDFAVAINIFGSDRRMALATGRTGNDEAAGEIEQLLRLVTQRPEGGLLKKILAAPGLIKYASLMPARKSGRGSCQEVIMQEPDLGRLPVLKCWPYDGGRFITLPCVHTFHPETGSRNLGMYRMQLFDGRTTGMHWHRHKTGANHYEAWKKLGKRMPVAVTLGGDPVYTYAATAPLPENLDEYLLAGFLRRKRVNLVRCLTQDLWVPEDADFVIEGYVDPAEDLLMEGPFGDHTGVYSLEDWYPAFHVTAITHRKDAIYPATIVGIPPQEDAWIGRATGKLFLPPIRMTLAPEVKELSLPDAGVAHNLVVVSISKTYPGQGLKVISSLLGAGQMMFSKFIAVVDEGTDISSFSAIWDAIGKNCSFDTDLFTLKGPLDVLDHSSDRFSFGGKMGIDATTKHPEELSGEIPLPFASRDEMTRISASIADEFSSIVTDTRLPYDGIMLINLSADRSRSNMKRMAERLANHQISEGRAIFLLLEEGVPLDDATSVLWQVTGNTDPLRDITRGRNIVIDSGFKLPRRDGFPREWPNVVVSLPETIGAVDAKWESCTGMELIPSPSLRFMKMVFRGRAEVREEKSGGQVSSDAVVD